MHKQAVLLGGFMKGKTMSECMAFPKEWEKFIEDYSFTDSEEVYTNGSELVPVFRVEQMVEHYFATDNNDGCKRIEELEAKLAEREKVVIQLRKQWQDAEMLICTMCGHFDYNKYDDMICGNMTCGEICGYPFCAAKFSPRIPVSSTPAVPGPSEDDHNIMELCFHNGENHMRDKIKTSLLELSADMPCVTIRQVIKILEDL